MREESGRAGSTKISNATSCAADVTGDPKNVFNPRKCNRSAHTTLPNLDSSGSALASIKFNFPGNKKASNGYANFFDRFRKLSGKGPQHTDTAVQKPTTVERDSRPLLFKFNEGFTNAVKRPVRMREFLL